jgi:hypothetical protein
MLRQITIEKSGLYFSMKKEIIEINEKEGIYRITTLSERWYAKPDKDDLGLPKYTYLPSATWVASYYYTSPYLVKWIAEKGLDESERLKKSAGDKGSKVHYACEDVDKGIEIDVRTTKYMNNSLGQLEELSIEEIDCIKSYIDYIEEVQPQLLASELSVFSNRIAGTIDKIWAVKNEVSKIRQIWIIDLKTSKNVWDEHRIQLNFYNECNIPYKNLGITEEEWQNRKLGILQLGYEGYRTEGKPMYKFTELEIDSEMKDVAYLVWKKQNPNVKPKEKDYPLILQSKLRIPIEEKVEDEKLKKIKIK